tara:strand:- start:2662 stop:3378 length:717 start_codon:yes stop_codon:yes gene_type:complete
LTSNRLKKSNAEKAFAIRSSWARDQLSYEFKNSKLLEQALTHRSVSKRNNERLEFLGDALLNFVVAQRLFEVKGFQSEGDMSRMRASLVKGETLAEIGRELALEPHVIVGSGELRTGVARRSSVLANTVEALIGAILLDGGFEQAEKCVNQLMRDRLDRLPDASALKDPKTRLQEWLQARGLRLPEYSVRSTDGLPHKQTFTVQCEVNERKVEGTGTSRPNAEQDAAKSMLLSLTSDN